MPSDDRKQILHAISSLDVGGVERWLVEVLRNIDRNRFHVDVMSRKAGVYDDEVRALGCNIHYCGSPRNPLRYLRRFNEILREFGPYDFIHSYTVYGSLETYLAARAGVPNRVLHNQNARIPLHKKKIGWAAYRYLMEYLARTYATHILAVSELSAVALLGRQLLSDPRYRWVPQAIDLQEFHSPVDRAQVRDELGIPVDAPVVGHVGRFAKVKNHDYLVDIAAELLMRKSNVMVLLVGDGPDLPVIQEKTRRLGIEDNFVFDGVRHDVPKLMLGAMDALVFPSKSEGLPRVVLEAQAAGLPCVLSDVIAHEVDVVTPFIRRHSIQDSPSVWADTLRDLLEAGPPVSQAEAFSAMEASYFNIQENVKLLQEIYSASP